MSNLLKTKEQLLTTNDIDCCFSELSKIASNIDSLKIIKNNYFFDNIFLIRNILCQYIALDLVLAISRIGDKKMICGNVTLTLYKFIEILRKDNLYVECFKSYDNIRDLRDKRLAHNQNNLFSSKHYVENGENLTEVETFLPGKELADSDFEKAFKVLEKAFDMLQQEVCPTKNPTCIAPFGHISLHELETIFKKAMLYNHYVKEGLIKEQEFPVWKFGDHPLWKQNIEDISKFS